MRKDVKIGLVMSLVFVVLAGWYYGRPADEPAAIQLDNAQTMAKRLAEKQPAKVETVPLPDRKSAQESTIADRSHSSSEMSKAPIRPSAKQSIDQRDSRGKNKLADSNSKPGSDKLLDHLTDAPVDGSDQLARVDQLVPDTSDHIDRVVRSGDDGVVTVALPVDAGADGDGATERHRVRAGDTMATVADIYYGDDKLVSLLAKANPELPLTGPLPADATVRIPPLEDNQHDFSDRDIKSANATMTSGILADRAKQNTPDDSKTLRTYKVQDGDSFYTIAASELGAASRWPELYDINKEVVGNDPNRLRAGLVLKIPENQ